MKADGVPCSPVLRWAGSKKRSLPKILPLLPRGYAKYIEVFAGSACLFFRISGRNSIISDNNVELMRFYATLSRKPEGVYAEFEAIPRTERIYYLMRSRFCNERDPIKRAAIFLYLNRNCFNGIYRTNVQGAFNVPFASWRVPLYPQREEIIDAAKTLRCAKIICDDFEVVCDQNVERMDFVYLDPPYYVPSKRVFREYSSAPFSRVDFDRLDQTLTLINRRGAYFLLSYPACRLSFQLRKRWNSTTMNVRRTIAGDVSSRRYAREALIYNYEIEHA